jgi:dynein heavy chain
VLIAYRKEVNTNLDIFEKGKISLENGKESLVISKNKPYVAGSISWARSIF